MVFDFGAQPPEVNSTRMYTGAGAGPMMAAAAAWSNLADELSTTARVCGSVISQLTGDEWIGASSVAMAGGAEPYVAWMQTTAGQLQHAADQAVASAAAYETAFAMTVPPPVVAANRARLAALVAANILGQNTPAIAATEAQYAEMWAQDAAAMYGYAGSSASAGVLTPLTSPPPTTNPGGLGAQAVAVSQAAASSSGFGGLVSSLPAAMQSLAAPLAVSSVTSPLDDFFNNNLVINIGQAVFDTVAWNMFAVVASSILNGNTVPASGAAASAAGMGAGVVGATAGPAGLGGTPVLAGMASASAVGKLSVPAAWSAAVPVDDAAAGLTGSGWAVPAEEGMQATTLPAGTPAVAWAGRGGYGAGPRYGVRPKVVPPQVLG
ncbi:PPE family protein [Mycobacterium persicum]|uniref:PPE family protein PPE51 n=1 Tax=Mycobacterium persicum TaxID=1487726 RepID=A0AB38URR6_9MYCO|nr:PPE family protein [Mycobacterium persicum]ORB51551.1 PPE family protein [Mycobacterium persicum]ORB92032.1 PPE family protein [Mycobacterium persicum]VAZ83412.1 putative PPE family protein PPE51 [Mycobacterium persicum]